MATKDKSQQHAGEAPEAPDSTEHGEDTGMKPLVDDLHDTEPIEKVIKQVDRRITELEGPNAE